MEKNESDAKLITVVIADDHALVCRGMFAVLNEEERLKVVGSALNGVEAVSLCEKYVPDILLLDLIMPDLSGIEVT